MTPDWMRIAEQELERGVREIAGPVHEARILEYHAATSLRATTDETPHCSSFVNWCMQHTGYEGTRNAAARSWLTWGRAVLDLPPLYGAIVVLSRGGPRQGHVGFYVGRDDGETVRVLSGNQGDRVSIARYPIRAVLDYRWPRGV